MLEESLISSEEINEENLDIVEELPIDLEGEIIEEAVPEEIIEENENDIFSESAELGLMEEEDPVLDELTENGLDELNEVQSNETVVPVEENNETEQSDQTSYEEEILHYIETLTTSVGVIQTNCKTGIENLQILSTCSLGINCMVFGGFVIYCFLNRLG